MKDPALKTIFAIPSMVELLVRRHRSDLASEIDFSTLEELPNELISKKLDRRYPDMLFLADRHGGTGRVLIHLEFQATSDAEMPLRNVVYAGLAVQKLRKHFRDAGESAEIAVVSMILYHGADPWRAPPTAEDMVPGITKPTLVRPEPVDSDPASGEHVPTMVLGLLVPKQTSADLWRRLDALGRALEPVTDPRPREGICRMLRFVLDSMYDHPLLKEPTPMNTMLEVFTEARDAERIRDRKEARREGRLEGQARTIVRLATQRFGERTARRLSRLLAGVTDPDRMDGVAEAVIDCGAGGEFLARVAAVLEADRN